MILDKTLQTIVSTLTKKYKCHTVILYGSRARGDFNENSDYDVFAVSKQIKKPIRIAKKVNNKYWDITIYPEKDLKKVTDLMTDLKNGLVLLEKNKFGTKLLLKIKKFDDKGPKKLARLELQLKKVWLEKTLARVLKNDMEGQFRRLWLIIGLLEDYFAFQNLWYRGSKESLVWLKENDPKIYTLYKRILANQNDFSSLKKLTSKIINL